VIAGRSSQPGSESPPLHHAERICAVELAISKRELPVDRTEEAAFFSSEKPAVSM